MTFLAGHCSRVKTRMVLEGWSTEILDSNSALEMGFFVVMLSCTDKVRYPAKGKLYDSLLRINA